MTEHSPQDQDRLEELVADALHQLERGEAVDLDALCAGSPELRSAVADAVSLVKATAFRPAARAPGSLTGSVFGGRYVLSECLGYGAMGAVYKADDLELGRTVAVKVLRTEMSNRDENERRFQREGEVLAQLNHPAIATIHDRKRTDEGQAYIVMEYLEGISMQHALEDRAALGKAGRMPVREAVAHAAQLSRALELAHEKGIVHRDVKPSNIMLSSRGPVLIDFGIATLGAQATLADGARGVGTPAYMAPEQLRADRPLGPSVDIYGLTASLYRALTGNAPYEGTPAEVLAAIPVRDPALPASLRPDLPKDLLAILDVGLNRDLDRRYRSMCHLREDLEAFLAHEPVAARYPGAIARLARRVRRSPAALAALAVSLAFVLGLVGYWGHGEYQRNRRDRMQSAYAEAESRLQPLLTLWNPDDRAMPDDPARARERELLDRAAANALHALPILATRAAFLWDQGDHRAAIADLESIARQVPGSVADFLVRAHLDALASSLSTPNLDGAPEPAAADEVYLLAFHELRRRNFKVARDRLFDPRLDDCEPALEQRLLIDLDALDKRPVDERRAGARRVHEAVLRMEERRSRTTAMTAHLEGLALLMQQRHSEALDAIRTGLELAPFSANLLENAGVALRRLGDLDRAVEYLTRAIALRPHSRSSYETLFWVHLVRGGVGDRSALRQAEDLLSSGPFPDRVRDRLRGEIDFQRALGHLIAADPVGARAAADAALGKWQQTGHGESVKVALATCLSEGRAPFADAANLAASEPSNWYSALLAITLMPDRLGEEEASAARALFLSLIREKAPAAKIDEWTSSKPSSGR
ncbi:MAG: protein kinase [Planctomycetes bacterium]|nr:protein kinase [Planctomycetota bacterium]